MDPFSVVILDVLAKESLQVALVDHDHVVQQLPSNSPDPALSGPVLPRAPIGGPLGFHTEPIDGLGDAIREDRVVVVDQEPGRGLTRERLSKLLDRPR